MVLFLIGVLFFGWITGVIPAIRIYRARHRIREWASREGFELTECRYSFWSVQWRVPFKIGVRDRTGRELYGVATVPGFIRREVAVDWGGSGRGQR